MIKKELIILRKGGSHCARGINLCSKCNQENQNITYSLYGLGESKRPEIAQAVYSIEVQGKKLIVADSNFIMNFKDENEAKTYSAKNNIQIINMIK